MKKYPSIAAYALLLCSAQNAVAQTQPQDRNSLEGSDIFQPILDALLPSILPQAPEGIDRFIGSGSLVGQRQMEGTTRPGDPNCGWASTGGNPGCQEIAPMAMQMTSDICNDVEALGEAESLLIAKDGIVVMASNDAVEQYSVASCVPIADSSNTGNVYTHSGNGHLRRSGVLAVSGYEVGDGLSSGSEWQDVLRQVLTGCAGPDGACTTSVARTARCDGAARRELLSDWGSLLEGEQCASVCEGVSHVYRRDDNAALSLQALQMLGVDPNGLRARATVLNGGGFPASVGATAEDFAYCDGGADEQYAASTNGSDPVRVPCEDSADLCGADGTTGVLQAIRSPSGRTYPSQQCGRNRFARVPWSGTVEAICPDGATPVAGMCNLPFREVNGQRDFDCINAKNSRPATLSNVDGRVYNSVQRDSNGNVEFLANGYPLMASFRQNMVQIDDGFGALAGTDYTDAQIVCQHKDATETISCLVAQERCSLGVTSRAAASKVLYTAQHEPLVLDGEVPSDASILAGEYPLPTDLYIAAIGGFEDVNEDCEERGHNALVGAFDYCFAQFEVSIAAWAMSPGVRDGLSALGYVSIEADHPNRCVGAIAATGCGAPTEQPIEACRPIRPSDR